MDAREHEPQDRLADHNHKGLFILEKGKTTARWRRKADGPHAGGRAAERMRTPGVSLSLRTGVLPLRGWQEVALAILAPASEPERGDSHEAVPARNGSLPQGR